MTVRSQTDLLLPVEAMVRGDVRPEEYGEEYGAYGGEHPVYDDADLYEDFETEVYHHYKRGLDAVD